MVRNVERAGLKWQRWQSQWCEDELFENTKLNAIPVNTPSQTINPCLKKTLPSDSTKKWFWKRDALQTYKGNKYCFVYMDANLISKKIIFILLRILGSLGGGELPIPGFYKTQVNNVDETKRTWAPKDYWGKSLDQRIISNLFLE